MKNKLPLLLSFAILFLSLSNGYAQNNKYLLRFKSGDVNLTENISEYNHSLMQRSTFNGFNYILLQFNSVPSAEQKVQIKNAGISLMNYFPNLSYLARIPVSVDKSVLMNLGVRAFHVLNSKQKMEKNLYQLSMPEVEMLDNKTVDVEVVLMDAFSSNELVASLNQIHATIFSEEAIAYKRISVKIHKRDLVLLAELPWVMWMEPAPEPFQEDNLVGKTGHRSFILNDGIRNLSGQGVAVGDWESADAGKHVDLYGRFKQEEVTGGSTTGPGGQHATQVTGTFVGGGLKDPNARGMAPSAFLYGHNFTGGAGVEAELQNGITNYNMIIGCHPYGITSPSPGCTGDPYGAVANTRDLFLNAHPEFINCYSAGNYQTGCSGGYFTTNSKAEKNTIVVGAVTNLDVMTTFSSWGPVEDFRIKPDLVGIGDAVNTCYPNHGYSSVNGTSFSTPGVAGVCAQLVQRYRQLNANTNPKNNLIKAVLCNTAKDLGTAGPDYKHGYGRINALRAVRALEQNRYKIDSVANGASKTISIAVPANTAQIRVMLTWNDPAAAILALPALVNDLNLSVIDPSSASWNPWVLDGANPSAAATRLVDNLNNIEQVTISTPAAGTYQIKVDGLSVTTGNTQHYSITWEIDPSYIEVVYPAGNEKLKNGVLETIRWDKEGVTGTQTVEYSPDGGANWNVLSSSVAAGTSHYNWSVPNSVQTSKAIVRVSSGALTDTSDSRFTIIGVPTGLTAADDPCGLLISWNVVTGATGYDVMLLDTVLGVWNVAGSNVSGTSYAVGGLIAGTRYWFTVRSRNASLGITGQRAVAINKINNNAGVVPTITVNSNVLSTQSATSYQWLLNGVIIPGATSQNYTVTQPGNYSVTVTNGSGCAATSLPIVFVFTGIENQGNANLFTVYPNPNNGVFEFEMNNQEENTTLVITNAIGQQIKVYQFEISSIHETIDLSKYDNGMYFVTLISGKLYETKKIIVNK